MGKTIGMTSKITPTLPQLSFLVDEFGDLIGFQYKNGQISMFPAGVTDDAVTASTASDNTGLNLNYRNTRVTTVATAGDSVVLPVGVPGMSMLIKNAAAANSMDVFPSSGGTINALSADTALAMAVAKSAVFYCVSPNAWMTIPTVPS